MQHKLRCTVLAAVAGVLVSYSAPALAKRLPCEAERRSPRSDIATEVTFVNHRSTPANIYWVNFDGVRELYTILDGFDSYTVTSYAGHVWVITENVLVPHAPRPLESCQLVYTVDVSGGKVPIP